MKIGYKQEEKKVILRKIWKKSSMVALFMAGIVMSGVFTGCSGNGDDNKNQKENNQKVSESQGKTDHSEQELSMEYGNVTLLEEEVCSYEQAVSANVKDMTAESIQKLNQNKCTILKNRQGKISVINGQYTDYKVSNVQEAYNSLMAVKELLALPMESIQPIKMTKEENVGTYYTFGKNEDGNVELGWVIQVAVDTNNTVQGLSMSHGGSSFGYAASYTSHAPEYSSDDFFENLTAKEAKAKDVDGKEVTIPVMYSESEDIYYMGDLERKIVVGVYEEYLANNAIYPFLKSEDNTWDDPQAVTVLTDLIEVYDFFAKEFGIYSVDGSGIPIMFYVHGTNAEGGVNADYAGVTRDFAWFNITDEFVGNISILAHEYTHGIFGANTMGSIYANETGSINEGYADVFGVLVDAYYHKKDKVNWYGREEFGPMMKGFYSICPTRYNSWRYQLPAIMPSNSNDCGGVHYNSALIMHLANGLEENHGLTMEDQFKMWKTALSFMISDENYDTLKEHLIMASRLHKQENWCTAIEKEFDRLGFVEGQSEDNWLNTTEDGCGRITIEYDYDEEMEDVTFYLINVKEGIQTTQIYKNTAGTITALAPAGKYKVVPICADLFTGELSYGTKPFEVEIKEGKTTVKKLSQEEFDALFQQAEEQ